MDLELNMITWLRKKLKYLLQSSSSLSWKRF